MNNSDPHIKAFDSVLREASARAASSKGNASASSRHKSAGSQQPSSLTELFDKGAKKPDADVLMIGASLTNCLSALHLADQNPDILVAIIDDHESLCEDRLWCFRENSVPQQHHKRIQQYISHRWTSHNVSIGSLKQETAGPVACLDGSVIADAINSNPRIEVLGNTRLTSVHSDHVCLPDGEKILASLTLDGRGLRATKAATAGTLLSTRFVAKTEKPHGLTSPIFIDDRVEQGNDVCTVQVLPLGDDTLSVCLTQRSARPFGITNADRDSNRDMSRRSVANYLARRGWAAEKLTLKETSTRPLLTSLDVPRFWSVAARHCLPTGLTSLMHHATTTDPVSEAIATAALLESQSFLDHVSFAPKWEKHVHEKLLEQDFYLELNEMILENSGNRSTGLAVLEHIHRLPTGITERFYAGTLGKRDKMRVSMVRPTTPIVHAGKAIGQISGIGKPGRVISRA